jgi:two-component system chemotaxis sensor kinase CheA
LPASDSDISIVERDSPDDVDSSSSFEPISAASLRVPVERVDRLLSELGELIQAKMGLDNSALEILAASRDRMRKTTFQQALRNLDRKIRILQDEILRVRMVPLDATFQMLERALREICRSTGKEARLVTTGAPVNLDKQVVEALTEPLVHLVRNAVDHGLDDTETRIQRGKPRVGTVKIDARPEGGYTVLEVSDDGSGLDLERIQQKARRMGLFREGESPTRAELLDVIFQPGFTVRDEATSVSGRGFGLDVVRAAVAGLGGLLNVDTRPGSTVFRLRVPTTLAITRALLVEAGGQPFFIPLASIDRVRPIHPREIERVGDEEVLVLEKRAVPVCNLAELLGLPGVDQLQGPPPAVFLGLAERRLVVLVDRLGGQQEIVVRGLGSLLPAVPGISGATTRGDGRTVLILDPAAILELAARVKAPVSP